MGRTVSGRAFHDYKCGINVENIKTAVNLSRSERILSHLGRSQEWLIWNYNWSQCQGSPLYLVYSLSLEVEKWWLRFLSHLLRCVKLSPWVHKLVSSSDVSISEPSCIEDALYVLKIKILYCKMASDCTKQDHTNTVFKIMKSSNLRTTGLFRMSVVMNFWISIKLIGCDTLIVLSN